MSDIHSIAIFRATESLDAQKWEDRLMREIRKHRGLKIDEESPDLVIVLGGDGTILKAVNKYRYKNPLFLGFNLGKLGFLASVRKHNLYRTRLRQVLKGDFSVIKRLAMECIVTRENVELDRFSALNEVRI